ncbi:MAG: putative glycoside hydrolase [bacterium]|nr:putative glycoside hydrolase [bacterium]
MTKGKVLFAFIALGLIAVVFLFFSVENTIDIPGPVGEIIEQVVEVVKPVVDPNADVEKQQPLASKPDIVKAVYVTGYAAGSASKMAHINDILDTTEINAVVLDVKDYTGMVSYEPDVEEVKKYGAFEKRIPKINTLIKSFHDRGVYVIGRIAVFQDQVLVKARPELALQSSSTGEVWRDYKKVAWLDTGSREVWDYNIAIAQDALDRGFDEVNFDYIRFASDGNLKDIRYPFFDESTLKHTTLKKFFEYVREKLASARLSADLFGLVTETYDGMGIGQVLEDSFMPFDYAAPMTYPSHYASGYRGFAKPATRPYEVMKFAMDAALSRLTTFNLQLQAAAQAAASSSASSSEKLKANSLQLTARSRFRPWIQDFDLGADYTAGMVRAQIQAIYDAGCSATVNASGTIASVRTSPCSEYIDGFMVWNPSNVYTKEAFLKE